MREVDDKVDFAMRISWVRWIREAKSHFPRFSRARERWHIMIILHGGTIAPHEGSERAGASSTRRLSRGRARIPAFHHGVSGRARRIAAHTTPRRIAFEGATIYLRKR